MIVKISWSGTFPVTEPMKLTTSCTAMITIVISSSGPTFFQYAFQP